MTTQQRLLVPLDESEQAEAVLPYAEGLARALGATLHLLAVVEPEPPRIFGLDTEIRTQLELELCQGMTGYLAAIAEESRAQGIAADTETVVGHPAEEILAAADRTAASMIIMATHGRGGLQRLFLGSVADKVMRTSSHPTLLVSPDEHNLGKRNLQPVALRRIAVPLDGSPLAEAALDLAGSLAAAAGARLLLVRVQSLPLTNTMAYPYMPDLGAVEADLEREAQQYLESLRSRLPAGVTSEIAVPRGVPVTALAGYFQENAVDLVVMTTHGLGGFHRLLVGSTADRLVRLGFPVLLVHATEKVADDLSRSRQPVGA